MTNSERNAIENHLKNYKRKVGHLPRGKVFCNFSSLQQGDGVLVATVFGVPVYRRSDLAIGKVVFNP
jgi:hypothetical protein